MDSQYKHGSARTGVQLLLSDLTDVKSPLKSKNLLFYIHSNKWFVLVDSSFHPPRSVSLRYYNEFTFRYVAEISGSDSRVDHYVEVVLNRKNKLHFKENGELFTSQELLIKMINSMYDLEPFGDIPALGESEK